MTLKPSGPTTNLQPSRVQADPNVAKQQQEQAQQAQTMQILQLLIQLLGSGAMGGMGGGMPGANPMQQAMGAQVPNGMSPTPFQGASASPSAPPVPIRGNM